MHRFTRTFLQISDNQKVNITISPLNGFGMRLGLRDSAFTVFDLSYLLFIFSTAMYFVFFSSFRFKQNVLNKNGKYFYIVNLKRLNITRFVHLVQFLFFVHCILIYVYKHCITYIYLTNCLYNVPINYCILIYKKS